MTASTFRIWSSTALMALLLGGGCSDPEADQREGICRIWQVPKDEIAECRRSQESFNAVLRPRQINRFLRVAAAYNADLAVLPPPRSATLDRVYAPVALAELASRVGYTSLVSQREAKRTGTVGSRVRVQGAVFSLDGGQGDGSSLSWSIGPVDPYEGKTLVDGVPTPGPMIRADIENLDRPQRDFLRAYCRYDIYQRCAATIYATVGVMDAIPGTDMGFLGLYVDALRIEPLSTSTGHYEALLDYTEEESRKLREATRTQLREKLQKKKP